MCCTRVFTKFLIGGYQTDTSHWDLQPNLNCKWTAEVRTVWVRGTGRIRNQSPLQAQEPGRNIYQFTDQNLGWRKRRFSQQRQTQSDGRLELNQQKGWSFAGRVGWARVSLEAPRIYPLNIQVTPDLWKLFSFFICSPLLWPPHPAAIVPLRILTQLSLYYPSCCTSEWLLRSHSQGLHINFLASPSPGLSPPPCQLPPPTATSWIHRTIFEIFSSDTRLSRCSLLPGSLIRSLPLHLLRIPTSLQSFLPSKGYCCLHRSPYSTWVPQPNTWTTCHNFGDLTVFSKFSQGKSLIPN